MVGIHESISPTAHQTRPRTIVRRTRGSRHGAITRLMSPSDFGQVLKPFVFLDLFDLKGASSGMGLHPHSGIATVPYYSREASVTRIRMARPESCWRAALNGSKPPTEPGTAGDRATRVRVPETVEAGELAVFEPSNDAIDIHADADTEFVLGFAAPHAHNLVLGPVPVHTSSATLRAGERRLRRSSSVCSAKVDSDSPKLWC